MIRKAIFLGFACSAFSCCAASPVIHPKASRLAFTHQGPFVGLDGGGILCIDAREAWRSDDGGKTWHGSALFEEPSKFKVSNERALLRTREGVIIAAWMNGVERKAPKGWRWGDEGIDWRGFVLPTYTCRSEDGGETWQPPVKLADPWCGCIHSMIQMGGGRIVLVGQEIIPSWRHATVMFVSDDLGKTWQRGDMLDYGVGSHDHAGSIEGTVVERKDGSLYLLLRTESGWLWEATSSDGLRWGGLRPSKIRSVTCCAQMTRLADGRIALLWNAPPRHRPDNRTSRAELSLAFSEDDALTWSKPVVVAADYAGGGRVSYPYLFECSPGELWITTMQGGLRMRIHSKELHDGEIPVFEPPAAETPKPHGVILFGDSTTALRPGQVEKIYSVRVAEALQSIGSSLSVHNAGIGGNTTRDARRRFAKDVLGHDPRIIVFQFGINDAAVDVWKDPPATGPRVPLPEYVGNLRAMIEEARRRGSAVILMTTNPVRWTPRLKGLYGKPPYDSKSNDGFETPLLLAYNEAVRGLAREMNVPLVDVRAAYPAFAASHHLTIDQLLLDGLHPNDLGHELVAGLLVTAIRNVLR